MGAFLEYLTLVIGYTPYLAHLLLVTLFFSGLRAMYTRKLWVHAFLGLIFGLALDPIVLKLFFNEQLRYGQGAWSYYQDNVSLYLSAWIAAGFTFVAGEGILALDRKGKKGTALFILAAWFPIAITATKIFGYNAFDIIGSCGWGLQYLGCVTPLVMVAMVSLISIERLGNASSPPPVQWFHKTHTTFVFIGVMFLLYTATGLFGSGFSQAILATYGIHAIALCGMIIVTGICGQISFASWGFMAFGAYAAALASTRLEAPIPEAIFYAALAGTAAGTVIGLFSFLKNIWLGPLTLFFVGTTPELMELAEQWTGGARGLLLPRPNQIQTYYLIFTCLMISTTVCLFLLSQRSKLGQAMLAVRNNTMTGIKGYAIKIITFSLTGFLTGIAGALFCMHTSFINPQSFLYTDALWAFGVLCIGCMGTASGPLICLVLFILVPEWLREAPMIRLYVMEYLSPMGCLFPIVLLLYWKYNNNSPHQAQWAPAKEIAIPQG